MHGKVFLKFIFMPFFSDFSVSQDITLVLFVAFYSFVFCD